MEQIQYIKDNDKFIKLHTEFDEYSVVKNDAYLINDQIFIYRGKYIKNSKQPKLAGLYLKENGTFVTVGKSNLTKDDIVDNNENSSLKSLLTNIRKMDVGKKEKKETAKKTQVKEKRKLDNNKRIRRDEVLNFTIFAEDDPMVRIIKEKINSISLTMSDIYESVDNDNLGYNLFYGLSTRPNMNWKTFQTWCDILEVEPDLTIRDKD